MKTVVKKKSSAVEKLSKKAKKKAGDAELAEEHELKVSTWLTSLIEKSHFFKLRDLTITGDVWVDRERAAVRDIQENRIIECDRDKTFILVDEIFPYNGRARQQKVFCHFPCHLSWLSSSYQVFAQFLSIE